MRFQGRPEVHVLSAGQKAAAMPEFCSCMLACAHMHGNGLYIVQETKAETAPVQRLASHVGSTPTGNNPRIFVSPCLVMVSNNTEGQ